MSFPAGRWSNAPVHPLLRPAWAWLLGTLLPALAPALLAEPRPPRGDADLRAWLENMVVHHRYTSDEIRSATGLSEAAVAEAIARFGFPDTPPDRPPGSPLKVLPHPGGRHPRLGFLDGAIDPQRDTKLSVFTPWDPRSHVVVDVPEAIWTGLGLTYLAHTHIDTLWTRRGIRLEPREWSLRSDGSYATERRLPNGITFGVRALPAADHVALRWWVRNGTPETLVNLRAQVCVLLGHAAGFEAQSADNKVLRPPFAAVRNGPGDRWVVTAWEPLDRAWQNPPVPCIHSDPALPDCPPGETREARGWLWFHEGNDLDAAMARYRKEFLGAPTPAPARPLEPVPEKLVVLTFDDSVASHHAVAAPLLRQLGFGATFFITEGFSFRTNKADYLTWEQIADLHRDGFEIGNHTRSHMGISADSLGRLRSEVDHIAARCAQFGIPRPVSFAYPGNAIHPGALPVLRDLGIRWARRGAQPEFPYETGRGVAYEPWEDHPLLIPTTGDARPAWTLEDLQRAVAPARNGRIAVLQFHGVPDREHPWVNTPPERFAEYMQWLKDNGYRCIAVRDLERFVDPDDRPALPWAVLDRRQAAGPPR